MAATRTPIRGPASWTGHVLTRETNWIHPLHDHEIDELRSAVDRTRGLAWSAITRDAFPLPRLSRRLAEVAGELEDGSGVVKVTGLPVQSFEEDELRRLLFGIGCHLGTPVDQNGARGLMRDIRDSGGNRVDSNGALRWHNDRTDVVGLLCVREANRGGVSRIVSAVAIHDAMLARRPDLVEVLFADFYRSTPGDEVGAETPYYPLPVFAMREGFFTTHYSQTYIEQAQRLPEVPRLTPAQVEALDMLQALAEELAFEMPLASGDMQFLNNHVIYHGRTAFEDDRGAGRDRLLYRIWLSMPNSRPLPESHGVVWGNVEAGALRGGVRA